MLHVKNLPVSLESHVKVELLHVSSRGESAEAFSTIIGVHANFSEVPHLRELYTSPEN